MRSATITQITILCVCVYFFKKKITLCVVFYKRLNTIINFYVQSLFLCHWNLKMRKHFFMGFSPHLWYYLFFIFYYIFIHILYFSQAQFYCRYSHLAKVYGPPFKPFIPTFLIYLYLPVFTTIKKYAISSLFDFSVRLVVIYVLILTRRLF